MSSPDVSGAQTSSAVKTTGELPDAAITSRQKALIRRRDQYTNTLAVALPAQSTSSFRSRGRLNEFGFNPVSVATGLRGKRDRSGCPCERSFTRTLALC